MKVVVTFKVSKHGVEFSSSTDKKAPVLFQSSSIASPEWYKEGGYNFTSIFKELKGRLHMATHTTDSYQAEVIYAPTEGIVGNFVCSDGFAVNEIKAKQELVYNNGNKLTHIKVSFNV